MEVELEAHDEPRVLQVWQLKRDVAVGQTL